MKTLLGTLETRLRQRLRPGWLRLQSAPAIRVFDSCFTVRGLVVPWDAVSRIRAWRDAPLDGAIRLDIGADEGTDGGIITVAEGQRGFDDFVAMADRKMTFPLGWWDHLDGPATRRQGVTLFERIAHG
jgi:hypothetical protein